MGANQQKKAALGQLFIRAIVVDITRNQVSSFTPLRTSAAISFNEGDATKIEGRPQVSSGPSTATAATTQREHHGMQSKKSFLTLRIRCVAAALR
jgi:hypothetical protein